MKMEVLRSSETPVPTVGTAKYPGRLKSSERQLLGQETLDSQMKDARKGLKHDAWLFFAYDDVRRTPNLHI